MVEPIISPIVMSDADELFRELRQADLMELKAASNEDPLDKIRRAVALTKQTGIGWSMRDPQGNLVLLMGASRGEKDSQGVVWLLGTDRVGKWAKWIFKASTYFKDQLLTRFPIIYNVTDQRNTIYSKWLLKMGFKFYATHLRYGFEQIPFIEFGMYNLEKMAEFEKEHGYV